MNRRQFVATSITAALTAAGTAGCLGVLSEDNAPPPRRSNLLTDIAVRSGQLQVEFVSPDERWLMSRRNLDTTTGSTDEATRDSGLSIDALSPVGTAAAKGRGATGRGASGRTGGAGSAPRTNNGFAWFFGGAYVSSWYRNNEEAVTQYPVEIEQVGVARLGDNETFREIDPGPGPVGWDNTYSARAETLDIDRTLSEGWYRVGANVVADGADGAADLGWESFDVRLQTDDSALEITEQWKVSPRI
ncbi:MAG: hypothetical protein J07HX64_01281 [halophilic archaeon J07HX64]|nr:MAG: hypothetical protein J07HX64_01281 [halophilic archaeon J07HX64]